MAYRYCAVTCEPSRHVTSNSSHHVDKTSDTHFKSQHDEHDFFYCAEWDFKSALRQRTSASFDSQQRDQFFDNHGQWTRSSTAAIPMLRPRGSVIEPGQVNRLLRYISVEIWVGISLREQTQSRVTHSTYLYGSRTFVRQWATHTTHVSIIRNVPKVSLWTKKCEKPTSAYYMRLVGYEASRPIVDSWQSSYDEFFLDYCSIKLEYCIVSLLHYIN